MENFDSMEVHCLKSGLGQKKRRVKFLTDGGEERRWWYPNAHYGESKEEKFLHGMSKV